MLLPWRSRLARAPKPQPVPVERRTAGEHDGRFFELHHLQPRKDKRHERPDRYHHHRPRRASRAASSAPGSSGDYAVIGTTLQIVGETLCEAVDLRSGQRVLDVAAGNGNATLAAARRFAEVVSTDYVGALLERGRERAAAERLPVDVPARPTPRRCRSTTPASTSCSRPSA